MQVTLTHGLLNLKRMEASKSLGPTDGQPSSRFRESCCLSWISCRVIDQSTQPPLPVSVHGGYTKCMDTCMHRTHICVCTGHAHVYAQNTKTCIHRTHIYMCIHRIQTHIHTSVQPWRRRVRLRFCLDTNILLFFKFYFSLGFLCVDLEPVLKLALWARLASNSQRFYYLCLPSAGIKDLWHHHHSN